MKETWWAAADAAAILGARGVRAADAWPSVAAWMEQGARGTTLSTDRDAAAIRLSGPDGDLLLKWRAPRPARRWKTWRRPSRERLEARAALAARHLDIPCPPPLLVGERRDAWGRLHGSVLLRPFLSGWTPADRALAGPGAQALLGVVVGALARWHLAGYRHGDAWPKNLLLSDDGRGVLPIGAPKARVVRPGAALDRARVDDLARLAAGLGLLDAAQDPLRFLPAYAEATHPGQRGCLTALRRLTALRLARVLGKRAEDERTRPLREPHGPPAPAPLSPDARALPQRLLAMARL